MRKDELIELLDAIAEEQSVDLISVANHPCNIAKRALYRCFEDIEILKGAHGLPAVALDSDAVALLVSATPYNPEW